MAVSLNRPGVVPSLSLKTRIKECCDKNPTLSAIAMLNFQTQIIFISGWTEADGLSLRIYNNYSYGKR